MSRALSVDEIRALPAAPGLVSAGLAFGIGRTKSHELARAGEFPVPLLRIGNRYVARRADILAALGIGDVGPPGNADRHSRLGASGGHERSDLDDDDIEGGGSVLSVADRSPDGGGRP